MARRRSTDLEPNRGWRSVILIAVVVGALDWMTKWMISGHIRVGGFVEVWDDRVALWHVRNRALVLGLFEDLPLASRQVIAILLAIAAGTLLLEIVTRAHRLLPHRRRWAWWFAGLLFGGMLGNLGERSLHWWVTDYLSFRWGSYWLPPGNVADLAIVISLPFALLVIAFEIEARAQRGSTPVAGGVEAPVAEEGPGTG